MKYKQLKLSAVLMLCLGLTSIQAQEALLATGGEASGDGGSVSYSVGQAVFTINTGTNGSLSPGVQQPYEISIITGLEASNINLKVVAYPNPTTDFLTLEIEDLKLSTLYFELYDIQGKLLRTNTLTSNSTIILMKGLPSSSYFLKVTDSQKLVKTFKIIKK